MEHKSPMEGGLQFSLLFLIPSLAMGATMQAQPNIRVLVDQVKEAIRIDGFDLVLHDVANQRLAHKNRQGSFTVECQLNGNLQISSLNVQSPIRIQSLGGFLRVSENQYRDELWLYSMNGQCILVNHVDLEKYVAGLLNSEMNVNWNLSVLKAQAIAARTYAIYQMRYASSVANKGIKPIFDLDSSVKDQVYEGAHQERYKTMQAVLQTRGQVLTFKGRPIKAFYHSTCGGKTEASETIWGVKYPYIRAVSCGYCQKSPRFNWTYGISRQEFEHKLKQERILKGSLKWVRVVTVSPNGRSREVEIIGSGGGVLVSTPKLRNIFGPSFVKSTDFSLVEDQLQIVFWGKGSGHGVGMCQWGARAMGDSGFNYEEILKHYYPEARLARLY